MAASLHSWAAGVTVKPKGKSTAHKQNPPSASPLLEIGSGAPCNENVIYKQTLRLWSRADPRFASVQGDDFPLQDGFSALRHDCRHLVTDCRHSARSCPSSTSSTPLGDNANPVAWWRRTAISLGNLALNIGPPAGVTPSREVSYVGGMIAFLPLRVRARCRKPAVCGCLRSEGRYLMRPDRH